MGDNPNVSMVPVASESTFSCEVIHASMTMKLVSLGFAHMYYGRTAHAFGAGIKCWHCAMSALLLPILVIRFLHCKVNCVLFHEGRISKITLCMEYRGDSPTLNDNIGSVKI